jgi:hypothetical protein
MGYIQTKINLQFLDKGKKSVFSLDRQTFIVIQVYTGARSSRENSEKSLHERMPGN